MAAGRGRSWRQRTWRRDEAMAKCWSYTAGRRGRSIRVYERSPGGMIYAATNDGDGGEIRRSLRHRDRERAEAWADREAAKLAEALDSLRAGRPTVKLLMSMYLRERTPEKSPQVQRGDRRRALRWRRFLGDGFDLSRLSRREWDSYQRQRRTGELTPAGRRVAGPADRKPVGPRTVEKDLRFLRTVCRWATEYRVGSRFLLDADPTRGLEIPREKNPNRPVATHDRVDAIREVYRKPTMRIERGGKRRKVESYLPEVFDLVVATGRRITAVCSLQMEDLELEPTGKAPFGGIVWPADTDKMGKRWRCPLSRAGREAIDAAIRKRERLLGRVGPGPLFPRPGNPDEPLRYEEASVWLRDAEQLAGLEPQRGSLWHAYRRLWASSRKDLPDVDVAQAGGWSSLAALQAAYQQPDDATMLRVVEHDAELREVT